MVHGYTARNAVGSQMTTSMKFVCEESGQVALHSSGSAVSLERRQFLVLVSPWIIWKTKISPAWFVHRLRSLWYTYTNGRHMETSRDTPLDPPGPSSTPQSFWHPYLDAKASKKVWNTVKRNRSKESYWSLSYWTCQHRRNELCLRISIPSHLGSTMRFSLMLTKTSGSTD